MACQAEHLHSKGGREETSVRVCATSWLHRAALLKRNTGKQPAEWLGTGRWAVHQKLLSLFVTGIKAWEPNRHPDAAPVICLAHMAEMILRVAEGFYLNHYSFHIRMEYTFIVLFGILSTLLLHPVFCFASFQHSTVDFRGFHLCGSMHNARLCIRSELQLEVLWILLRTCFDSQS